jgi:xylulokinase
LLCINGTGIFNKWIKNLMGSIMSYDALNESASYIPPGSDGLFVLPFGNGAERMFNNRIVGSHIHSIDLNKHTAAHVYRAGQEGIAFAFRYGLDILRENNIQPSVIRAGKTNMFLSSVFTEAFVNATNVPVELYECDGSVGAALGAGIGSNIFTNIKDAYTKMKPVQLVEPTKDNIYQALYEKWKQCLEKELE